MYTFLTRNGQTLAFVVGILITAIFLLTADGGKTVDFGIGAAIGLAVICAAAMLLFGLYQMATNPKGAIRGIIGVVLILVLFFIFRSAFPIEAVTERGKDIFNKFNISDATSGTINGAIGAGIAMLVIAFAAFIFSEIRNFFK